MTNPPPILRSCALAIPVVAAVAWGASGVQLGIHVGIAGAVSVANLAAMAWIGSGLTRDLAADGDGALWLGLLAGKFALALPVFGLLMSLLSPLGVALGLCSVVLGVSATALVLALESTSTPALESP